MKISIITWDASFRESFHTVDSYGQQDYPKDEFEFFYCDFYNNKKNELIEKLNKYPNTQLINLDNNTKEQWHLGKTINKGISKSNGDILIIPDGDIIVPHDFLRNIEQLFNNSSDNLVCYFRRWDEPEEKHNNQSYQIKYLSKVCKLNNMTNYGGCFAIKRSTFEKIGFYEEHSVFSGPGANGLEQFKRFRNAGLSIMWSDMKIFHPFHSFTGSSDKIDEKIITASKTNPWIFPYMGLEQSWVLKQRDHHIHWKANDGSIDSYLTHLNPIEQYINQDQPIHPLKRMLKKIIKPINLLF